MFYLSYIGAELRRRKGRTFLTALGLGVGVGLVVAVSALSSGLDRAQKEVLKPLTGVGTDLSVTRPLKLDRNGKAVTTGIGPGSNLSAAERRKLQDENGRARLGLGNLGKAGEKFTRDSVVATTNLSFPASEAARLAKLDGVQAVAPSLTLTAITVSGTVPKSTGGGGFGAPGGGSSGGGPPQNIDFESRTVTGVDQSRPSLAPVTRGQISSGRWFSTGKRAEAVLGIAYARRKGLGVGDLVTVKGKDFRVIGLSRTPLGGDAADLYVKLGQLQTLAGRAGRANLVNVRADSGSRVGAVEREIKGVFPGAAVTTSEDLANRVGGSLADAQSLTDKLGSVLVIVALAASILIASLLTLTSVAKRTRELGTLKAIGWRQRLVVRQVTGESLAHGLLGGVMGAAIGVAGAALIGAVGPELKATVAAAAQSAGPGGPGGPGGFGQGAIAAGSEVVKLDAPVDAGLVLLAIGLAVLGGLLAGAAGALRAARLRPADALRNLD